MKETFFPRRKRFPFWRVFWVAMAIYLFFTLIGVIAMYVSPTGGVRPEWEHVASWQNMLSQIFNAFFYSVFFYVTLNLFYNRIAAKKGWQSFVELFGVAGLMMGVYFVLSYWLWGKMIIKSGMGGQMREALTPGIFLFGFVMALLFGTALSFAIAYLVFLRDDRKQRKVLEEQKMQLEVEKSQANFNFLKAQINPHFLHNTLNFLYAKSLPYSTELSEGILTLSDIMRYALGPAARDGKVALKDEIEHVRNVIKINQLRYANKLRVDFDVTGVVNGATVVPFVLITLVENAFKHGDFKSSEHPIQIKLDISDGRLRFFCRNKKKGGPKEISTGIGLDNIKKQLDLTYGRNYSFDVRDEAEFYTTELTINAV